MQQSEARLQAALAVSLNMHTVSGPPPENAPAAEKHLGTIELISVHESWETRAGEQAMIHPSPLQHTNSTL